ncbi:MAG TPA: hypothetical protein PLZ36_05060 [Armatimonadota bacterium]|nr:hypothetical protein [Armatimonadota bacterium]HOS42138.1 hypothetical protein [Armatimonadota bacterium]
MARWLPSLLLLLCAGLLPAQAPAARVTVTSTAAQTAVLDPANWSKVYPHARDFDAIRPMLVRFPGLAEQVYAQITKGYTVEKVELVLEWAKQEGPRPERGRHGWGAESAYEQDPGKWSALARPVLRPWSVDDPALGPTAAAYINGHGYWSRGGGIGDGQDRLATTFGPLPLHAERKTAAFDLTPLLNDRAYGATVGARLRGLEERGLQVHKAELFDLKYNGQEGGWFDVYSWRVETGYMKIWVNEPALVVTLRRDPTGARKAGALPKPLDFAATVAALRRQPRGQSAYAPPANWQAAIATYTARPAGIPDWQWQRLRELRALAGWHLGRINPGPLLSGDPAQYERYAQSLLTVAPHHWDGHLTSDWALAPAAYPELFNPGLRDHLTRYWAAWLHPETADTENPRQRGYFRSYSRTLGTQNFNTNAIAGAYLGAQYLNAPYPLADARYGLENLLLRCYGFYNGANQEAGDTYYQALSVAGLQMIGKYAADPCDKLMGEIASEREMEQLISVYHPGLRRMTYPMGRGELKYQLLFQDGPYHAVHTLSRQGALIHTDLPAGAKLHNVPAFGAEGMPGRYAALAPWGPAEWTHIVDDKTYPWTARARVWHFAPDEGHAGWNVNSLGTHWSLGTRAEIRGYATVTPLTAQWRRADRTVTHMEELSTLQMSFGINGVFLQSMVNIGAVQQHGKAIALTALPPRRSMSTPPNPDYAGGWRAQDPQYNPTSYHALHASLAIMTFGDVSRREVWIGDRKVDQLSGAASPANPDPQYEWERFLKTTGKHSVFAKAGETILIKDGVTYLALTPIALNPLARDEEVEVAYEWPVLYVNTFLYRGGKGVNLDDLYTAERKASAGYVIEMGDESEYGTFEQFRDHITAAKLTIAWVDDASPADAGHYHAITYRSGEDTLEMGFHAWEMDKTFYSGQSWPRYIRVNGANDYLPAGIQRDTPWSIQGSTGVLKKGGATLLSEPGYRTYLLAETQSGTYTAYNPMPDPIYFRFLLPGGQEVRADGRLGMTRMRINPADGTAWIDYQLKPEQRGYPTLATALLLTGFARQPAVVFNGAPLQKLATVTLADGPAWVVPLGPTVHLKALRQRGGWPFFPWGIPAASGQLSDVARPHQTFFHDWYIVGPFDNLDYAGQNFQLKEFGPEQGLNLQATYTGLNAGENGPAPVQWRPLLNVEEPALSDQPVDLLAPFDPNRGVIAYLAATIVSDRDRTVQVMTGGDERLAVWVNGERVVYNNGYRLAYKDQDRAFVTLKTGENPVLLKVAHGHESWRLYFRLADEQGLPLTAGVSYAGARRTTPAGRDPLWEKQAILPPLF